MNLDETRYSMVKQHNKEALMEAIEEGKVDRQLIDFLIAMNEKRSLFTSSSCAGRILLLAMPGEGTKKEAYFYKRWHREVSFEEVWASLKEAEENIWFKMESFILHIGMKDIETAEKMLAFMKEQGIKRGGIITLKEGKILIELVGTNAVSMPVKIENEIIVSESFMRKIIDTSNSKLRQNYEKLDALMKGFLEEFD